MKPTDDLPAELEAAPSKTQRKRELHALQELGARITKLPRPQRDALPQSDRLAQALQEYDRIRSREAQRRQRAFIGKLLRTENLDALMTALDALDAASSAHTHRQHALTAWRDALIASDAAVDSFLNHRPAVDRPRLRNTLRAARRELSAPMQDGSPRRHYRKLLQLLREETADNAELLLPPRP